MTSMMTQMGKIDRMSKDTLSTATDLFATENTYTSLMGGDYEEIAPIRSSESGSQEFVIRSSSDYYLDLLNTYMTLKVKVVKADGSALGAVANVTVIPEDSFCSNLFDTAELSVHGQVVQYEPYYSLKCYINTLLNYGKEAKLGQLTACGWIEDSLRAKTTLPVGAEGVADVLSRKALIAESREMEFIHYPQLCLFNQEKYISQGVSMSLTFRRGNEKKCLRKVAGSGGGDGYKILITSCTLWVRKVRLHPGIEIAHRDLFAKKEQAKYPLNRVRTSVHVLTPGSLTKMVHLIVGGQTPKKIVLMLIDHEAMEGDYAKNPCRLDHCGVQELELTLDSGSAGNGRRQTMNYEQGLYARAYATSMISLGKMFDNSSCSVSYKEFADGNTFYGFDLTHHLGGGVDVGLIKNCNLSVHIKFARVLTETFNLVCYFEYDEQITIDNQGVGFLGPV